MVAAAGSTAGAHQDAFLHTTRTLARTYGHCTPRWAFALDGTGSPSMLVLFDDRLLLVVCTASGSPSIRYRYPSGPLHLSIECDASGAPDRIRMPVQPGMAVRAQDTYQRLDATASPSGFVSSLLTSGWVQLDFSVADSSPGSESEPGSAA
jgi:hypothetical protein